MPRVLVCVLFLIILVGCGGSPITPTVTTAVMETPGPQTAEETAYLQALTTQIDARDKLGDDLFAALDQRTGSALWQRQTQAVIDQWRASLDQTAALHAPLRLQPLDQHIQAAVGHYRAALDVVAQSLPAMTPPPDTAVRTEMDAAHAEMDLAVKLLKEFTQLRSRKGS